MSAMVPQARSEIIQNAADVLPEWMVKVLEVAPKWVINLVSAYPNAKVTEFTFARYEIEFADVDELVMLEAVNAIIKKSTWWPSVAELHKAVKRVPYRAQSRITLKDIQVTRQRIIDEGGDPDDLQWLHNLCLDNGFTAIAASLQRRIECRAVDCSHANAMARMGYELVSDIDGVMTFRHSDGGADVVTLH